MKKQIKKHFPLGKLSVNCRWWTWRCDVLNTTTFIVCEMEYFPITIQTHCILTHTHSEYNLVSIIQAFCTSTSLDGYWKIFWSVSIFHWRRDILYVCIGGKYQRCECFCISNTSINGKIFTKLTVGRDTWRRVDIILLCVREKLNFFGVFYWVSE